MSRFENCPVNITGNRLVTMFCATRTLPFMSSCALLPFSSGLLVIACVGMTQYTVVLGN